MVSSRRTTKRPRRERSEDARKKARPFESPLVLNSAIRAQRAFQWLLSPTTIPEFFSEHFETKPLLLKHGAEKFNSLFSISDFSDLVRSAKLCYSKDLDVTSYSPKEGRSTLNKEHGTTAKQEAWAHYKSGCSLRLLRPQEHSAALWSLCALLESYFQCPVGANAYLTPGSTQGFAPHFDDIDAFICQVEGRKHWKVYAPAESGHDVLPRASSIDFTADEMRARKIAVDAVLEPGDMLYLPRGAIHEARGVGEAPSLHVTLSACQSWTWADFLQHTVTTAIKSAAATDVALRRTLPLRFAEYVGQSTADRDQKRRDQFDRAVRGALRRVGKVYPIDAAADTMAELFMRDRLPPPPSVVHAPGSAVAKTGKVGMKSSVRATGHALARLVVGEDGLPKLVHCLQNERSAGKDRKAAEFTCTPEEAGAVDYILSAYPREVIVEDIPLEKAADRVELVEGLVEMGIVRLV